MVVFRCLTLLIDSRMFGRSRALQRSETTNSGARQSSVWSLAIAAAPLSIAGFFDSISTSMPRLAAARWCTAEDLGIFVAINYVGVAVVLAMNSIYYSRITAFASLYAAGSWRRLSLAVARLAGVSFFVAAAAVFMAVLIGDKAIGLVYGQGFVSGHRLLCWTLAGAGVTCVSLVGVVLLTAVGRYRAIGLVYLGYTIILSFALYVGGQSGDIESIAIAAFIAGFFQMLIVSVLVFRTLRWATPQVAGVV